MAQTMMLDAVVAGAAKPQGQTPAIMAGEAVDAEGASFEDVLSAAAEGLDIAALFQMPEGAAVEGTAQTGATKAVALENLAAGTPANAQSLRALMAAVKEAVRSSDDKAEEPADKQADNKSLAVLLAALAQAVPAQKAVQTPQDATSAPAAADAPKALPEQVIDALAPAPKDAANGAPADEAAPATVDASPARHGEATQVAVLADALDAEALTADGVESEKAPKVGKPTAAAKAAPAVVPAETIVPEPAQAASKAARPAAEAVTPEAAKTDAKQDAPRIEVKDAVVIETKASKGDAAVKADKPVDAKASATATDSASQRQAASNADATPAAQAQAQAQAPIAVAGESAAEREVIRTRAASGEEAKAVETIGAPRGDAAAKTDEAAAKAQSGRADQERLIQRIADAMTQAEQGGRSTIRMRLYPPELGTIRIEVTSVRGTVTARIETSTVEAQGAINQNLPALRAQLADSGVEMRDVQVQYRNAAAQYASPDRQGGHNGNSTPRQPRRERFDDSLAGVETAGSAESDETAGILNVLA